MDRSGGTHAPLATELPEKLLEAKCKNPTEYIKNYLNSELPESDRKQIDKELEWNFLLQKFKLEIKTKKVITTPTLTFEECITIQVTKRKTFLTRKERVAAGVATIPKTGWNYAQLNQLRSMWRSYMRDTLDGITKAPKPTDPDYQSFVVGLGKCELIGAEVEVTQSKTPSVIGKQGTVVLETTGTLQIVAADNRLLVIPKQQSVFTIILDSMRFTIYGKSIVTRPGERSSKKIKSYINRNL